MKIFVITTAIISLCRITSSLQEDRPEAFLTVEENLTTPGGIIEGNYVELKCIIRNWKETFSSALILFYRNDRLIRTNERIGIVVWGDSLIFQDIKKSADGKYECDAHIPEVGSTLSSNAFYMTVSSKPNVTDQFPELEIIPDFGGGSKSTPNIIEEFENVLLLCDVQPNTTKVNAFRWYLEGSDSRVLLSTNITAGIRVGNSIIEFTSIKKTSEGSYVCQADTKEGIINSSPYPISIKKAVKANPKIMMKSITTGNVELRVRLADELQADNIPEFTNVMFICEAKPKSMNISNVRWFHNNTMMTPMLYYNKTTLFLSRLGKTGAGPFFCEADSNVGHLVSPPVIIQIKNRVQNRASEIKPILEAKLEGSHRRKNPHIVKVNDTVYITCEIRPKSVKIHKLRWFYYNKELTLSPRIDILHSGTLVLLDVDKSTEGCYSCLAETETGPIRSNEDFFFARGPLKTNQDEPTVIAEMLHNPDFIYENDEVRFYCNIYPKLTSNPKITWFRDGKPLKPYQKNNIVHTRHDHINVIFDRQTLIMRRVKIKDMGLYNCKLEMENNMTITSFPADLSWVKSRDGDTSLSNTGLQSPTVTLELQDASEDFYEKDTIAFYCNVKPNTTKVRHITWFRDNQKLNLIQDENISFNKRTLKLDNVNIFFAGKYSCMIDTDQGTFISNSIPLPKIHRGSNIRLPWNVGNAFLYAELGDMSQLNNIREKYDIYLICIIRPPKTSYFELTWYRNDWPIQGDEAEAVEYTDGNQKLHLYGVRQNSSGVYTCQADTKKGYLYSTPVQLDVKNAVA